MDDAGVMRSNTCICGLLNYAKDPRQRERLVLYVFAKLAALNELVREIAAVLILADLIDRNDVRMIQRRDRLGFLAETASAIGVECKLRREKLYCYVAVEFAVKGGIDLAHATLADLGADLITPELSALIHYSAPRTEPSNLYAK